ncbi:MAG: aldehyde dehydrogenase family protein [bacterium]|nr:aldehyde dehydrogenase family protein [bacterium]
MTKRIKLAGNDGQIKLARHIISGFDMFYEEKALEVFNPATGKLIGKTSSLRGDELNFMEESARKAQEHWHHGVSEQEKEAVFRAIIKKIEENRGSLARTMVIESGKLWRWADAEIQETIDTLWHYHGEISRCHTADGFVRCQLPDKNAYSVRVPYGLIYGITPWNFPLAIPFWKICGALAGDNAVVIKASEQTPFIAYYAVKLILEAIRETITDGRQTKLLGLVQLVQGMGETSGKLLLNNLNYDKAAFTGGAETGKIIAETAGARLKPCHLELGGHAAMVVLDDFDIDLAVAEAINANLGDSGQRCVSARVVFVQENKYGEFIRKYIARAEARKMGDPMDFETEMGPLISKEQIDRVVEQVGKTAKQAQKEPRFGGDDTACANKPVLSNGYFYSPTIFTNIPYGTTAMDEEIFGPVIVINPLPGKNREEAFWNGVDLINRSKHGLSNALLTNDRRLSEKAPWHFKTGLLYIGRGTTGAELNKYFGGVKASGWGKEGKGLDDWTRIVQVYNDYHGKARMAQAGADEKTKKIISESKSPLEK